MPVVAALAYVVAIPLSVVVTGLMSMTPGGEGAMEPEWVHLNARFWAGFACLYFAAWTAPRWKARLGLLGVVATP